MSEAAAGPRYGIDPYLDWVSAEGMPVIEGDYAIDLFAVETGPWARVGTNGAAVHLKGRGDFCNMFLFEIAPGGSTAPMRRCFRPCSPPPAARNGMPAAVAFPPSISP